MWIYQSSALLTRQFPTKNRLWGILRLHIPCTSSYYIRMARPKKRSDRHQQKTVSFRLPQSLMARFRKLAEKNRRTLSGEAQLAFENHLSTNGFAMRDGEAEADNTSTPP